VAQGLSIPPINAAPPFGQINISPFPINGVPPVQPPPVPAGFPEMDLSVPTQFRSGPDDIPNVTQAMVDDPSTVLKLGVQGKNIISTATLVISTDPTKFLLPSPPVPAGTDFPGSGLSNISFLQGTSGGPNAQAALMQAIFWIETIEDSDGRFYLQLQYQQLVLLNFNGLSWPHVSVATLIKQKDH
jgi:hypothetical protein